MFFFVYIYIYIITLFAILPYKYCMHAVGFLQNKKYLWILRACVRLGWCIRLHKCRGTWKFSRKTCPGTWRSSTQSRWWWCHLQGPSACHPSPKRNRQLPCLGTSLHSRNARVSRPVVLEAPWRWLKSVSWTCLPMTIAPPWLWECWPCIPALFVTRASGAQSCLWWSPLDL